LEKIRCSLNWTLTLCVIVGRHFAGGDLRE
jgi:hypothetical protein